MCGIAGYSLTIRAGVDRTLAAQALLAAIAERGADAVGYAHRGAGRPRSRCTSSARGASELLDQRHGARSGDAGARARPRLHEGPPVDRGEQPPRPPRRRSSAIHNGIIVNDDELFAAPRLRARRRREMTVDSEAIFALAEREREPAPSALEQLRGSMATAWLDERGPTSLFLARGVGPAALARPRDAARSFFASTRHALEIVERYAAASTLHEARGRRGHAVALADGRVAWTRALPPDRSSSRTPLPAVRAPRRGRALPRAGSPRSPTAA